MSLKLKQFYYGIRVARAKIINWIILPCLVEVCYVMLRHINNVLVVLETENERQGLGRKARYIFRLYGLNL